jgi:putative heme-binding domain-containing protein
MRRAGGDVTTLAARLARDADPGVRREVALSMRDVPADKALDILVDIARGYDGQDRSYLEAFGIGATGKEPAVYDRVRTALGVKADPLAWSPAFTRIAWRLHVPASLNDVVARAKAPSLSAADRRVAIDTLAFIKDPAASKAMLEFAAPASTEREMATWWLLNRMSNDWADYGLKPALKAAGIYDPDAITLKEIVVPPAPADLPQLSIEEIVKLQGDPARGKNTTTKCLMCHVIGGTGAEVGPVLDGWGRGKAPDVIAKAIVQPSAEIAQGFEGMEIKTKDGLTIQGLLIKDGDPLMMRSMGGVTQVIPADRVASRRRMMTSLMIGGAQLGLSAQDVADVIAFLRTN